MRQSRVLSMIWWSFIALGVPTALVGCLHLGKGKDKKSPPPVSTSHAYKGTASVGDFITFQIDTGARTISYHNLTNGLSGTGTFTVNTDGSYAISESSACFTDAYEIPGYALVLRGTKTGPGQNTTSLVTSIDSQTNTIAGVANRNYNYMQFRTNSGGLEVGHLAVSGTGSFSTASYWPFGNFNGGMDGYHPAEPETDPVTPVADPSTGALKIQVEDHGVISDTYIFATTNGLLAIDTPNGSLICLREATSSTLLSSNAGSYRALRYGKDAASTGMGNVETPAQGTVDKVTISVAADGTLLITDAANTTVASGTITPVAGSAIATGIGESCPGLFHADIVAGGVTQEVFITFTGDTMLFSSFRPTSSGASTYDYFYGVGLKQLAGNG